MIGSWSIPTAPSHFCRCKTVNYAALTAVLIEAVKSQQAQIRSQQLESHTLRAQLIRLEMLEDRFVQMQSLLSELLDAEHHRSPLVRTGDGR